MWLNKRYCVPYPAILTSTITDPQVFREPKYKNDVWIWGYSYSPIFKGAASRWNNNTNIGFLSWVRKAINLLPGLITSHCQGKITGLAGSWQTVVVVLALIRCKREKEKKFLINANDRLAVFDRKIDLAANYCLVGALLRHFPSRLAVQFLGKNR